MPTSRCRHACRRSPCGPTRHERCRCRLPGSGSRSVLFPVVPGRRSTIAGPACHRPWWRAGSNRQGPTNRPRVRPISSPAMKSARPQLTNGSDSPANSMSVPVARSIIRSDREATYAQRRPVGSMRASNNPSAASTGQHLAVDEIDHHDGAAELHDGPLDQIIGRVADDPGCTFPGPLAPRPLGRGEIGGVTAEIRRIEEQSFGRRRHVEGPETQDRVLTVLRPEEVDRGSVRADRDVAW